MRYRWPPVRMMNASLSTAGVAMNGCLAKVLLAMTSYLRDGRMTVAILHAAAEVRDLNFNYLAECKGAPASARFGEDGITVVDPLNEEEPFRKIYGEAV